MRIPPLSTVSFIVYFATTAPLLVNAFQTSGLNFSVKHAPVRTSSSLSVPTSALVSSSSISSISITTSTSNKESIVSKSRSNSKSNSKSKLQMSSTTEEESKCPVTQFSNRVVKSLSLFDRKVFKRLLRITNHAPALLSLSYFGLVSMASMMTMGPMAGKTGPAQATIASVLTRAVGSTTNAQFAALFPTYVTPAPFVFLVWPTIAILQLLTVTVSAIFPSQEEEILTQNDLSALTLANLCSTAWLLSSSNAAKGALPISSFLILPLVPLTSGFTLRNKPAYVLWAYQLFSSFTTLASILAFTVELQHGGRIPFIGTLPAELAACVFLSLYSTVSLGVKDKSSVKKFVNLFALSGILVRRVGEVMVGSTLFGAFSTLVLSVSFWGTIGCWFWSAKEFFTKTS